MIPLQSIWKLGRMPALLALAFPLVPGNAAAATYDLVVMPFIKAMPDGASVTMWGFAQDGATPVPSVPGPALVVPPGDASLTVNLRNALTGPGAEPVSIVIPGQAMPTTSGGTPLAPVKFTDSESRQRVSSFTAETAPGASGSYTWNNLKPGTYLYHSGTHPQVQVQMGLYGAMTHDAVAAGANPAEAYAGVPYASEVTLLFSEIDPALHATVAGGQYGPTGSVSSTIDYVPKYFLINGEPHTAASLPLPAGNAGQTTLLRLLNAGLQSRSPVLQGMHMRLVAEDGKAYPHAREQYSAFLPALKTVDAVITPTAAAYPLYDRRLAVTNPGASGSVAGGMLAKLEVAGATGTPVAVADNYGTDEDTVLSVPSTGVLANDIGTAPLTAALVAGPTHSSTFNLSADGSFAYTPQPNYNGPDSFSYRVMSGGVGSAPATVSLTVNPVNDPPLAANNAYSVAAGTILNVGVPGVLGNDSDVDGNALSAVNPSALAGLTLNANGSFSYTATSAGNYSFTYQASDGTATSAAATVAITVLANQAPVAVNDTVNAPRRTAVAYTPVVINVLANDNDANGNLDPSTVAIVVAPNKGGTVSVNANGTVSYTPRLNFRGTENFSYRVMDSAGATSNTAIVRVNVK